MYRILLVVSLLAVVGCGDDDATAAQDAGGRPDAGTDAGRPARDAGGERDSGGLDAGSPFTVDPGIDPDTRWVNAHMHYAASTRVYLDGRPYDGALDSDPLRFASETKPLYRASERWSSLRDGTPSGVPGRGQAVDLVHIPHRMLIHLWDMDPASPMYAAILEEGAEFNTARAEANREAGGLLTFPMLECVFRKKLEDADFVDACIAEATEWVERGRNGVRAKGFKDHFGGTRSGHLLPYWNAFNGYTTGCDPADDADMCMTQPTVRYPMLEEKWRQVLRYITEDLGVPYLTHTHSQVGSCYVPTGHGLAGEGGTRPCEEVTVDTQVRFAEWAASAMGERARRRVVLAHMGYMMPFGQTGRVDDLVRVFELGLSADLSATAWCARSALVGEGGDGHCGNFGQRDVTVRCRMRALLGEHSDHVLFGDDGWIDESDDSTIQQHEGWFHALEGPFGDSIVRDQRHWYGLELGTESLPAGTCPGDVGRTVPPGTLGRILRDNFVNLYRTAEGP